MMTVVSFLFASVLAASPAPKNTAATKTASPPKNVVAPKAAAVTKAVDYAVAESSSKVQFKASGNPGFIRINGDEAHAKGKVAYQPTAKTLDGSIVVVLKDFTTGMSLRDKHMKEKYLEVGKFPDAELKFAGAPLNLTGSDVKADLPATLTLHGVTKPVKVAATLTNASSNKPHVNAVMTLVLTDFGIEIPSFAGVTVARDVEVDVDFDADRSGS